MNQYGSTLFLINNSFSDIKQDPDWVPTRFWEGGGQKGFMPWRMTYNRFPRKNPSRSTILEKGREHGSPPPPPHLRWGIYLMSISFLTKLLSEYFSPSDVKIGLSKVGSPETFSVLYLNIGSLRKNLEDVNFSIVCFWETWTDENKLKNDSLIQLPGYVLHQIRKNCRGGGISIFLHKSLYYKRRQNWYKFGSSGLFYHRNLEKLFLFFHFNLNVLDFENNKKVQNFINLMFLTVWYQP